MRYVVIAIQDPLRIAAQQKGVLGELAGEFLPDVTEDQVADEIAKQTQASADSRLGAGAVQVYAVASPPGPGDLPASTVNWLGVGLGFLGGFVVGGGGE